jgi:hypothetical protein
MNVERSPVENSQIFIGSHCNNPQRRKLLQQHSAGRLCGSSSAISRKSGFVAATSEGTSCSFSVSPTTLIPSCPESVESTSSRNSRGRLATTTRTLVSMRSSEPPTLMGN